MMCGLLWRNSQFHCCVLLSSDGTLVQGIMRCTRLFDRVTCRQFDCSYSTGQIQMLDASASNVAASSPCSLQCPPTSSGGQRGRR